jgi:hypothetical protein
LPGDDAATIIVQNPLGSIRRHSTGRAEAEAEDSPMRGHDEPIRGWRAPSPDRGSSAVGWRAPSPEHEGPDLEWLGTAADPEPSGSWWIPNPSAEHEAPRMRKSAPAASSSAGAIPRVGFSGQQGAEGDEPNERKSKSSAIPQVRPRQRSATIASRAPPPAQSGAAHELAARLAMLSAQSEQAASPAAGAPGARHSAGPAGRPGAPGRPGARGLPGRPAGSDDNSLQRSSAADSVRARKRSGTLMQDSGSLPSFLND